MTAENWKGLDKLPDILGENKWRCQKEAEFLKNQFFPKLISFFLILQTASWAFHFSQIVILKSSTNEIAESIIKIYRKKQGAKIIHY